MGGDISPGPPGLSIWPLEASSDYSWPLLCASSVFSALEPKIVPFAKKRVLCETTFCLRTRPPQNVALGTVAWKQMWPSGIGEKGRGGFSPERQKQVDSVVTVSEFLEGLNGLSGEIWSAANSSRKREKKTLFRG